MPPSTPEPAERERRIAALVLAGTVLYAAGALAQHFAPASRSADLAVRLVALILFAWACLRRRSLTGWILLGMIAGLELGVDAPHAALASRFLSDIFLRLIRLIVAPLILGTLITGIAGHADGRAVGRMGVKSLVYFEVLTTIALLIGLAAINLDRAGAGLDVAHRHGIDAGAIASAPALSWQQFVVHIFPENIAAAIARNDILEVAVFAILFGLALGRLGEARRAPLLRVAESLTDAMFVFTNYVMYYAPVGVGAALAYTVAHSGVGVMFTLGKLVLTLYAALIVFVLAGMLPAALLARIPIRGFLRAVAEPATIAFATSTSEAALPRAMEAMEAFGVPRGIVAFVIPTGYAFNMAGSALYLSIASIFTAQAAGIHMSFGRQMLMLLVLMVVSKGVAGVARAALVLLLATASMFGLPTAPILIILGVDTIMDMGRTVINVTGNCLACAVVARWEGQFRQQAPAPETMAALEG
jgi:proton glutamate symport protein